MGIEISDNIRVLDQYVVIKQIVRKKKNLIHLDMADKDTDKFDYEFIIVQLGEECKKKIAVGEHPIFTQYVQFSGLKLLEKNANGMTSLVIVHENDIIGIDNEPIKLEQNENSTDKTE